MYPPITSTINCGSFCSTPAFEICHQTYRVINICLPIDPYSFASCNHHGSWADFSATRWNNLRNIVMGPAWTFPWLCQIGSLYCMQWKFPKTVTSRQRSDWRDHHVPYSATDLDIFCLTAAEIYIIYWVETYDACSACLSKYSAYQFLGLCRYSCRRDAIGVLVSDCIPGWSVHIPVCSWDVRDVPVGSWWIFCRFFSLSYNTESFNLGIGDITGYVHT